MLLWSSKYWLIRSSAPVAIFGAPSVAFIASIKSLKCRGICYGVTWALTISSGMVYKYIGAIVSGVGMGMVPKVAVAGCETGGGS